MEDPQNGPRSVEEDNIALLWPGPDGGRKRPCGRSTRAISRAAAARSTRTSSSARPRPRQRRPPRQVRTPARPSRRRTLVSPPAATRRWASQHVGAQIYADDMTLRTNHLRGALCNNPCPVPRSRTCCPTAVKGGTGDYAVHHRANRRSITQVDVRNSVPDPELPCQTCLFLVCFHCAPLSSVRTVVVKPAPCGKRRVLR